MNRISCIECRQCNHKGKPSVSRLSKYCDTHYKYRKTKKSLFSGLINIKNKLFEKRYDENKNDLNSKGFRKSWFLR